ncbi:MAG: Uma2 family endonuclease [Verrucomicrobia bacterium]|nr:Uma2 family endonuclease [Verrucomicrobiota bacterium]
MIAATETSKKVWTEEELQSLPDDGFIHEVVDGDLVMSPKNNFQHERICGRLYAALYEFNRKQRLGVVLGSSAGYWMFNRNRRAPDVSFIPKARLEKLRFSPTARNFLPGAPDLAVEILLPNNTRAEMDESLHDFFGSVTQITWLIHPDTESAEICRSLTQRRLIGPGGELDGEHLLPGFRYPINDLFKDWDWE